LTKKKKIEQFLSGHLSNLSLQETTSTHSAPKPTSEQIRRRTVKIEQEKMQGIFNEEPLSNSNYNDDDDNDSTPYKAIYDFVPESPGEVGFSEGDIVYIFSKDVGDGWWRGEVNGVEGIMPSSYLQKI